ncbi:MAG: hypothetical protein LC800_09920 [Acidobacteria bacterium]|nr:hypothetical protein [Acidobacteriota bacterium]
MSEVRLIRFAWKRVLPFAAALAVGVGLTVLVDFNRRSAFGGPAVGCVGPGPAAPPAWVPTPLPTVRRELPSVHVLSPMLMSEVQVLELLGKYEGAYVVSPPGVGYTAAKGKDYRQGVLQVNFLFGTDGKIHDVVPVEKRVLCGLCLEGDRWVHSEKVVHIDRSDPRLREYVDAAAEALGRVEFVPTKVAGHPYPTHGFAECVFRLD